MNTSSFFTSHRTPLQKACRGGAFVSTMELLSIGTVYYGRQFAFFGSMGLVDSGIFGIAQMVTTQIFDRLLQNCFKKSLVKYVATPLLAGSCCYGLTFLAVKVGLMTSTLTLPGAAILIGVSLLHKPVVKVVDEIIGNKVESLKIFGSLSVFTLSCVLAAYSTRSLASFGTIGLATGGLFGVVQVPLGIFFMALLHPDPPSRGNAREVTLKFMGCQFVAGTCCYAVTLLALKVGLVASTVTPLGAVFLITANSLLPVGLLTGGLFADEWRVLHKVKKIEYYLKGNLLITKPALCSLVAICQMKAMHIFNIGLKTGLGSTAIFSVIQDIAATCLTSFLDKKHIFSRSIHTNFVISHLATGTALYSLFAIAVKMGLVASNPTLFCAAMTIGTTLLTSFVFTKMIVSHVPDPTSDEAKYLNYAVLAEEKHLPLLNEHNSDPELGKHPLKFISNA